ncbi:MAG: glutamine amidotransferase [Pirellulales bacterium]|nr:glutamine amidotransferase [Pirellulales bacterium]
MSSLSFTPVGGPWFATLVAALLVLTMLVGPAGSRLSRQQRLGLLLLRASTALLLLLVMWRPTLVATETRQLPGSLVFLLDSSRSMQIGDSLGNDSRWNAMKSVLASASDQLATLAATWDLKIYQFDESTRAVTLTNDLLHLPLHPDGPQTAIGSCLENVLEHESQQRVVAVLLLSDGAQRALAPHDVPPQTVARRLATDNIPLYTFAFGKPALGLQSDLRVEGLLLNDVVFAETPVSVQVTIGADGYTNQTHKVHLLWETPEGDMEVVDTRQVLVDSQKNRKPVSLTYTPRHPGEYKVSVQIESPEGELAASNNLQSTFVAVRKGGINVLYLTGASRIGGHPGIEPRFVRAALAAHADLNLRYEVLNYRKKKIDFRASLEEGNYDVYVLGDVDVNALDRPTWNFIAEEVDRGAGLVMLGGFHSFGPGGFRGSPLAPVLPLAIGPAERQNFGEAPRPDVHIAGPLRMVPVPMGDALHPIVRITDSSDNDIDWAKLPLLDGANRFERSQLKPNAQVIATSANTASWPLLVAGAWGNGRTLAFAVDSTWHWQMEGFGDTHRRFWRQLIMWLARKDGTDSESVWVRLDGRRYQRGSRVEFSLGALDKQRETFGSANFDINVHLPDGSKKPTTAKRRGKKLVGFFEETVLAGDYRVSVVATENGQLLGSAEARFIVPDLDMELDQPAAEPTLLKGLAGLTAEAGGEGLAPEELPELLEQLLERKLEFQEEIKQEQSLWDTWPTLLSLVGLLVCEWYLRKRWGLV